MRIDMDELVARPSRIRRHARDRIGPSNLHPKLNAGRLIDCLDAKPKVTPSCDCGVLFTCPIVEGIQASESLP